MFPEGREKMHWERMGQRVGKYCHSFSSSNFSKLPPKISGFTLTYS